MRALRLTAVAARLAWFLACEFAAEMRGAPLRAWLDVACETLGVYPAPYEVDATNYWGKSDSLWYRSCRNQEGWRQGREAWRKP